MVAFNDRIGSAAPPHPNPPGPSWDGLGFRCYGLMDERGRWGSWLFAPATARQLVLLEHEAARRKRILFLGVQTFAPPPAGVPVRRWKQVREHYVGADARPHLAPLYFDIDCAGDLDKALLAGRYLVEFLVGGLELAEETVRVWFSGSKGFHILVHPAALGLTPSTALTKNMKLVVAGLVKRLEAEGFVDNQFGPGAAGALSFNVMAAVAQYYSDNLQTEVLKGMDEKVKQGWLPGWAPYGYRNVPGDREKPIQIDPAPAHAVARIFELYSKGDTTFEAIADQLAAEGYVYRPTMTRFYRTELSRILHNRFYLGEIVWHGKTYPGKQQHLVSREIFDQCQAILAGKNRRFRKADHSYAGGLFRCAYCGQSLTGERIRRRLRGGEVREHLYYRCANNHRGPDHPPVRWSAEKLEQAVLDELDKLRLPTAELQDWFREALVAAFADVTSHHRRQTQAVDKRRSDLKGQQDRLLNGYLNGIIDEAVFQTKSAEFKCLETEVCESGEAASVFDPAQGQRVLETFDFSQRAAEEWRGSNNSRRREIIEAVSLNRAVSDVSLCVTKRKPFDILAERPSVTCGRGDRI